MLKQVQHDGEESMSDLTPSSIPLPTGVTLNVQSGGPRGGEPIILLHGFPESHRTWRSVAPELGEEMFVVAPDQRGFAGSDKPEGIDNYRTDRILEDLIALADALELETFTLAGHDWGGALAWLAALRHPGRVKRLVIVNSPHPLIFQKSLIEDSDQRAASQYIRAFRTPGMERAIEAMGFETFYEKTFGSHADLSLIPPEERQAYLDQWSAPGALTAMLNWYRASEIVVPAVGEDTALPAWTNLPFPSVAVPTLVIWGLKDKALLPVQLGDLHRHVEHLALAATPDAGHFIPWEHPQFVIAAIRDFIAETP
jgi:pimeloyl-ACP methyl ester carboxylesterase